MRLPKEPSLADLFDTNNKSLKQDLWTAAPAIIDTYNSSNQTAGVKLATARVIEKYRSKELVTEQLPIIPVKVCFPSVTGGGILFDIGAGDEGIVIFCKDSIGVFRETGKPNTNPGDISTHSLNNGLFFPTNISVKKEYNPLIFDGHVAVAEAVDYKIDLIATALVTLMESVAPGTGTTLKGQLDKVSSVACNKTKVTHEIIIPIPEE